MNEAVSTTKMPSWLLKRACSRCGTDTYRIAYIWRDGLQYLVCAECFGWYARGESNTEREGG